MDGCTEFGRMKYKVIIVPELNYHPESTVRMLDGHIGSGGKVIFLGSLPKVVDGDDNRRFDRSRFSQYRDRQFGNTI